MTESIDAFERLVGEAEQAHFSGWDFSYLRGRSTGQELPWDYAAKVRRLMWDKESMLDMGTGGGELLASLAPLPSHTRATEGYAPNVLVARERLQPLGVQVLDTTADPAGLRLPFAYGEFQLVINRHEAFYGPEVWRVLREGGHFVTQQVGSRNDLDLNKWLQGTEPEVSHTWDLDEAVRQLSEAGFEIVEAREAFPETTFLDIGAVVYQLRAVPWQVEDFDVEKYRDRLLAVHRRIEEDGGITSLSHRFYVQASKLSRCSDESRSR